jgi:hypothetical protein
MRGRVGRRAHNYRARAKARRAAPVQDTVSDKLHRELADIEAKLAALPRVEYDDATALKRADPGMVDALKAVASVLSSVALFCRVLAERHAELEGAVKDFTHPRRRVSELCTTRPARSRTSSQPKRRSPSSAPTRVVPPAIAQCAQTLARV